MNVENEDILPETVIMPVEVVVAVVVAVAEQDADPGHTLVPDLRISAVTVAVEAVAGAEAVAGTIKSNSFHIKEEKSGHCLKKIHKPLRSM